MKKRNAIWLALAWLLCVSHQPVHAYLDPGSGSMLLQLILGGVAGAAVIIKLYWRRALEMIGMRRPADDEDATK